LLRYDARLEPGLSLSVHQGGTVTEASTECLDALICSGARLTGYQRRSSIAEVATELCEGSARQAKRRFGWGRETVLNGLHEAVSLGASKPATRASRMNRQVANSKTCFFLIDGRKRVQESFYVCRTKALPDTITLLCPSVHTATHAVPPRKAHESSFRGEPAIGSLFPSGSECGWAIRRAMEKPRHSASRIGVSSARALGAECDFCESSSQLLRFQ
jgi:hypothetical protein